MNTSQGSERRVECGRRRRLGELAMVSLFQDLRKLFGLYVVGEMTFVGVNDNGKFATLETGRGVEELQMHLSKTNRTQILTD